MSATLTGRALREMVLADLNTVAAGQLWLTTAEVAELLRKPSRYVDRICQDGRLTYFTAGRERRFRREWVADFLASEADQPAPARARAGSGSVRRARPTSNDYSNFGK